VQPPTNSLRDFALNADGERGAVLAPGGDIAWLCAPRWESPAVFAALLGGGGGYGDRPLGEREGSFVLCGFVVSLAHHALGDRVEAFRWFERNRAAAGSPGLFAEEFDVQQRQLRGTCRSPSCTR